EGPHERARGHGHDEGCGVSTHENSDRRKGVSSGFNFHFFLRGTFAPERRASDRPMAIACLRLRTVLPERPLLSLPRFISCIARLTFLPLDLPYLRAMALHLVSCTRASLQALFQVMLV